MGGRIELLGALALLSVVACAPPIGDPHRAPKSTKSARAGGTGDEVTLDVEQGAGLDKPRQGPESALDDRRGDDEGPGGGAADTGSVGLSWNKVAGFTYALDVQSEGKWIRCRDAAVLGAASETIFDGSCPSAADKMVPFPSVTAFRLYYSNNGSWTEFAEQPFDGTAPELAFALPDTPPASVAVRWNRKTATAEYSLDIKLADGTFYGPCINAGVIRQTLGTTFEGACVDPVRPIDVSKIREFRICWAEGGNWAAASCFGVPYNGLKAAVEIPN
jgi:hypothetical protein